MNAPLHAGQSVPNLLAHRLATRGLYLVGLLLAVSAVGRAIAHWRTPLRPSGPSPPALIGPSAPESDAGPLPSADGERGHAEIAGQDAGGPAPSALPVEAHAKRATPASPVYLNLASEDELRRLPGVGAKRARDIVAKRNVRGPFRRLEELLTVRGVSRKLLEKWRPLVRLEASSAPPPGAG